MSENAATPVVPKTEAPVVPTATPASNAAEMVNLSKEAHDQLVRDAARASEAQSRADRYESVLKKNGLTGGGHFKPATPATPPTPEERQAQAADEDRKAEKGLLALALDPIYRDIFDKEPLLLDMLTRNPLAILPVLAPEALDADDAVSLVREALNKRKPVTPPANPPTPALATPPVGAINANDKPMNEEVEAARKLPNTERAIAGMIGAKLRASGGKK